jgi:hypothetical protein
MHDLGAIRDRFLRDNHAVRLGGLAANLARASSCSSNPANSLVVNALFEESKWFIEWTAADYVTDTIDTAAQLVQLQVQLSRWQMNWDRRWADPIERARIGTDAKEWSDRVMAMSGLLD